MIFGYRTEKAMSSIENWKAANKYASCSLFFFSVISLGLTILLYGISKILGLNINHIEIAAWIITFAVPISSIIYTEIKLKNYDHNG